MKEIPPDLGGYLVDNYHILIVLNAAKEARKLILNYFGTSISSQKKSERLRVRGFTYE